jgi:2-iminoacetate synthase ThiH
MDLAYQYRDPERLNLNVTNRCTNRCSFCVRTRTARLGDDEIERCRNLEAQIAGVSCRIR